MTRGERDASRSRAVYEAATSELEQLIGAINGGDGEGPEQPVMDWDALYEDDAFDRCEDSAPERSRGNELAFVGDRLDGAARVTETWTRLEVAEQATATRRVLDGSAASNIAALAAFEKPATPFKCV